MKNKAKPAKLTTKGEYSLHLKAKDLGSAKKSADKKPKISPPISRSDTSKKFGDGTRDSVDEASWESFPASDPPAWSVTRGR